MKEAFQLQNPWRNGEYKFPQLRQRVTLKEILKNLHNNEKIIGLLGSRQVGKSSILYLLIRHLINDKVPVEKIFYFNLDNILLHELFESVSNFLQFVEPSNDQKTFIFIDEIQRLENPGLFLKELYDLKLNIKIFYSGSSQIELKSKLKENLVGRVRQFNIPRLSFLEYVDFRRPISKEQALNDYMLYGSYPELALLQNNNERKILLRDIHQTYIEKDIVDYLKLDNVSQFNRLLILLAHQIGSLLNIESIANSLKISRREVEKYISILESTFIIKRIYPYFKNYKKEITKTPKVFFLDLGIRNYLLNNFLPLNLRDDVGNLFENFYLLDLLSKDIYGFTTINYWRTTNQTEIDFITRSEQGKEAIEVKYSSTKEPRSFKTLNEYYPDIKTKLINKDNFLK